MTDRTMTQTTKQWPSRQAWENEPLYYNSDDGPRPTASLYATPAEIEAIVPR